MGKDKKGGNMSKIAGDINAEMMKKAIHDSRAKLFAEIAGKTGSQQSVIDCAMQEIESLRQQLAAALTACKLKDEALEKACTRIEEYGFEIGEHWNTGRKALAIQPDDSALKAWLGSLSGSIG